MGEQQIEISEQDREMGKVIAHGLILIMNHGRQNHSRLAQAFAADMTRHIAEARHEERRRCKTIAQKHLDMDAEGDGETWVVSLIIDAIDGIGDQS